MKYTKCCRNCEHAYLESCKNCSTFGDNAYENFELRKELAKIESGKLVAMPCEVGNKVWTINYDDYEAIDVSSYVIVGGNADYVFLSPFIWAGRDIETADELCDYYSEQWEEEQEYADIVIRPKSDVFLTKEAAEAKLAELRGEKNGTV